MTSRSRSTACSRAQVETDAARTYVTFSTQPGRALFRRQAGDRRRRDLFLAAAARPRPAELPHLLRQGRQGRGAVRAHGALRSDRRRRPRAAADPRPDAGAGQARDRSRHVRGHDVRAARSAAGPISVGEVEAGRERHASSAIRTIGAATSRSTAGSGISTTSASTYYRDANSHFEAFKKGLYDVRVETDPGRWETAYDLPAVRDGRVVKEASPTACRRACTGLVFNTRRPMFRRHPRARGDLAAVRLRVGQPQLSSSISTSAPPAISTAPICRRTASPPNARERALLAPFPDAVRADIMDGTWRRRSPTAPAATARRLRARFALFDAGRLRAQGHAAAFARASGRPFAFRNPAPPRAIRSGWRSPLSRNLKRAGIDARVRMRRRRAIRPPAASASIST